MARGATPRHVPCPRSPRGARPAGSTRGGGSTSWRAPRGPRQRGLPREREPAGHLTRRPASIPRAASTGLTAAAPAAVRTLTTGPIPYGPATFEISFDRISNLLGVSTSEGSGFSFTLDDLPVAAFYKRLVEGLGALGIHVSINTNPFDLDDEQPLDGNGFHCSDGAYWTPEGGTAILMYEDVRKSDSPIEALLAFLERAYQAGAKTAGWDVEDLRTQPTA
ncbi:MAG: DUF5996 family protein [Actinomycetota bacterium]|nr:DUF5996 family protein [Actinomycetota bacterium]